MPENQATAWNIFIFVDKTLDYIPLVPFSILKNQDLQICAIAIICLKSVSILVRYAVDLEKRQYENPFFKYLFCQNKFRKNCSSVPFIGPLLVLIFDRKIRPYAIDQIKKGNLSPSHKLFSILQDPKMIKYAIKKNPEAILNIKPNAPGYKEALLKAVSEKPCLIDRIKRNSPFYNEALLRAVSDDPSILEKLSRKHPRYKELALKLVNMYPWSIDHLKITKDYDSILLNAFSKGGHMNHTGYEKLALEVISKHPEAIQYLNKKISNYVDIVLECIRKNLQVFEYLDPELPHYVEIMKNIS